MSTAVSMLCLRTGDRWCLFCIASSSCATFNQVTCYWHTSWFAFFFFSFFLFGPQWLSITNLLYYHPLGWCCDLANLFSGQRWSVAVPTLRMFFSRTTSLTAARWIGCHRSWSPSRQHPKGSGDGLCRDLRPFWSSVQEGAMGID